MNKTRVSRDRKQYQGIGVLGIENGRTHGGRHIATAQSANKKLHRVGTSWRTMRRGVTIVGLFVSVLVTPSATAEKQYANLPYPPERISRKGFSFQPLAEEGWVVLSDRKEYLYLGKRLSHDLDATYVIQAKLLKVPTVKTAAEFLNYVKGKRTKSKDQARYAILENIVEPYGLLSDYCVKFYAKAIDNAPAKFTKKTGSMMTESYGIECRHTGSSTVSVYLAYSHRYYPGEEDASFPEKAKLLLSTVEFSQL